MLRISETNYDDCPDDGHDDSFDDDVSHGDGKDHFEMKMYYLIDRLHPQVINLNIVASFSII